MVDWNQDHLLLIGGKLEAPPSPETEHQKWRKRIEPWLSSIFQSEHLSLLVGNGLTSSIAVRASAKPPSMNTSTFGCAEDKSVLDYATKCAKAMGRGHANFEDQLSAAFALTAGYKIIDQAKSKEWETAIDKVLTELIRSVLAGEKGIEEGLDKRSAPEEPTAREALVSFLMSFASRASSRERLHVFTTNYDRLIERAADLAGLRIIDRFVGALEPEFRSSRLQVDLHYMPPGVRGEPRHLEGVIHLTKLHGSLDWRYERLRLWRCALPFGAEEDHPALPKEPSESVMIYPNAAKDMETAAYPYADLFRDFSAALCRPNSVLVTYGYGFGDDHVNRVIADMLTIPSTHLVIVAWSDKPHDRVKSFVEKVGHQSQLTLLLGKHFGDLRAAVSYYLPKPAIDPIMSRLTDLKERRGERGREKDNAKGAEDGDAG